MCQYCAGHEASADLILLLPKSETDDLMLLVKKANSFEFSFSPHSSTIASQRIIYKAVKFLKDHDHIQMIGKTGKVQQKYQSCLLAVDTALSVITK